MKIRAGSTIRRTLVASAAAAAATVMLSATPALADDNNDAFTVVTTEGYNCGTATFIDYGSGDGTHPVSDDWVWINDNCLEGKGTKVSAALTPAGAHTTEPLGSKYIPDGAWSQAWDPFPNGDVKAGDTVILTVCTATSATDLHPINCDTDRRTSTDG
ncbi:hypothetical protein [Rugosimonospora africana]|uniref:Secreted protein n=1 Tax=Rugosimonospora africana TaxID=556532 RepID=A0A8J3QZG7_9ACTN|nr:hypothetical protein [Rugosimonospora africana]GIH19012.1 hypothetical protein Raf01_71840 [Rugosimonospora africana]